MYIYIERKHISKIKDLVLTFTLENQTPPLHFLIHKMDFWEHSTNYFEIRWRIHVWECSVICPVFCAWYLCVCICDNNLCLLDCQDLVGLRENTCLLKSKNARKEGKKGRRKYAPSMKSKFKVKYDYIYLNHNCCFSLSQKLISPRVTRKLNA